MIGSARPLAALSALALCSACAATAPLSPESAGELAGATLAPRTGDTPAFAAMTPGKAGFGLIGAALMRAKGNEIVADNGLVDPAGGVAAALAADLAARYGARPVEGDADAAFALEVTTTDWSYLYYFSQESPLPYRVVYSAEARLVDLGGGTTVAEGRCLAEPGEKATAPTLERMLADGARRLKDELAAAAALCVEELRSSVFGAEPPSA